ncbi:MAG: hypothetical protein HY554_18720 [Elusimicrobia bacterium]|nr:hypothetical protein [Elusimicrobiota bacterium]
MNRLAIAALSWLLLCAPVLGQAEADPCVVYVERPDGVVVAALAPEFMEELRARVPPYHRGLALGTVVEYAFQEELRARAEAFASENGRRPSLTELRELAEGASRAIFGEPGGTRQALLEREQRVVFEEAQVEQEKLLGFAIATAACLPGLLYCVAGTALSVAIDSQERENVIALATGAKRVDELSWLEQLELLGDTAGVALPSGLKALWPRLRLALKAAP